MSHTPQGLRKQRRHKTPGRSSDVRSRFRQDRDRVLYSQAFRRLSGITQVVPPREALMMHNRMIHSLKVGQVARGVADYLLRAPHKDWTRAQLEPFLDPDVAEFAGLAHDLGHPPFGHAAEHELQRLVGTSLTDSFEGNAQTFRILTRLAHGSSDRLGPNITRAGLRSVLKYPWPHNPDHAKASTKWGCYQKDAAAFRWVLHGEDFRSVWATKKWTRRPSPPLPLLSLEAQVMDWADDVTYAVHDLEDFFRVGVIPLRILMDQGALWTRFCDWLVCRWVTKGEHACAPFRANSPAPPAADVSRHFVS